MMDKCFDAPLLPSLINAGIVPLLRWALDDTSLTSVSATISAIHNLLISKADEVKQKIPILLFFCLSLKLSKLECFL